MALIIRKNGKTSIHSNKVVNEAYLLGIVDGREHMRLHERLYSAPMAYEDMKEAHDSACHALKVGRLSDEVAAHTRGFRDFFKNQMKKAAPKQATKRAA